MSRKMLWRWRRNPLRRRSDRAEAWLGVATVVVLAVGAPAAGAATGAGVSSALLRSAEGVSPATAVLEESLPVPDGGGPGGARYLAEVRWTGPDGEARSGEAWVGAGAEPGGSVPVWVDADGELRDPPLTPAAAYTAGALLGGSAAAGVCLVALGVRGGACARLDAGRARRWEREWARVAPQWSPRA
ncbi:hypothetical protein RM780_22880 [Streptomyces sp. DSM 44917]|uniref:Membrane protein SCJ1.26 n=1 Tax=Streptomyces boetiae TaxID=3075541 RepID=A0ABU2LET4_9ACTN|nr:hypothetical protein [Streptomyces sp. DSM 44917]MDT0309778.1 hypothetical protein [Streptomyces sp. DSM 44917]